MDDADPQPVPRVVALLDELAGHATAPQIVEPLDGWRLRASPEAPFRRANSVLAIGRLSEATDLDDAIRRVEEFYASNERPARFQVSPAAQPPDLDAVLAARGYVIEAPVVVMGAGATIVLGRTKGVGRITKERGKRAWERAYASMHGDDQRSRDRVLAYGRAINALTLASTAAVAPAEPGQGVALGFAVAERGWTGIFGMGTRPEARRRGAASAVLHTLTRWAVENESPRLYLQVEEDNEAARTLYTRAGFVDTYRYHYRTRRG